MTITTFFLFGFILFTLYSIFDICFVVVRLLMMHFYRTFRSAVSRNPFLFRQMSTSLNNFKLFKQNTTFFVIYL